MNPGALGHEILTVKEVGELLKVTQGTVYKLVKEGRIPAFKIGGDWRFRKDVISAGWLKTPRAPLSEREVIEASP